MRIFRRLALVAAACTTALVTAFGVGTPASAAGGWTITPGGPFTAGSTNWSITENTTGTQYTCAGLSLNGQLSSGTVPGPVIGTVSSVGFSGCTQAVPSVVGLPWSIDATGYNATSDTVTGALTGVHFHSSQPGCTFDIMGPTSTTGSADFTYSNPAHVLTLLGTGNLRVANAFCLGLVNDGDTVSFKGTFGVSPSQIIRPADLA